MPRSPGGGWPLALQVNLGRVGGYVAAGAIVGVGATQRASAVRWGVAGSIVWAWIFTIPASAFVAAVGYWVSLQLF